MRCARCIWQLPGGSVRWSTETRRDAANALNQQSEGAWSLLPLTVDYVAGAVAKASETGSMPLADPAPRSPWWRNPVQPEGGGGIPEPLRPGVGQVTAGHAGK